MIFYCLQILTVKWFGSVNGLKIFWNKNNNSVFTKKYIFAMDELELETKLSEMISNTFWVTSWNNFPVYNSGISQRVKSKYPLWSWNTPSDAEIHTLSSGICNFQWLSMSGIWSMWVVLTSKSAFSLTLSTLLSLYTDHLTYSWYSQGIYFIFFTCIKVRCEYANILSEEVWI